MSGRLFMRVWILGISLFVIAGVIAFDSAPASASTFTPTNSESLIVSMTPASNVIGLEVLGGDAALRLEVEPGHEVVAFGYQSEPYLRITADGDIETNLNSPATYSNATRSGAAVIPDIGPEAAPNWKRVGQGQSVVWHDHRMHTMPGADQFSEWSLKLQVDGVDTIAVGSLTQLPAGSPLPWIALALLVAVGVFLLGRCSFIRAGALVALGVAILATVVVLDSWLATPSALGRSIVPICVGGVAILGAAAALFVTGRARLVAVFASLALSAGVLASTSSALTAALIPGPLAPVLIRVLVAVGIGAATAAAGLTVLSAGEGSSPGDLPARPQKSH